MKAMTAKKWLACTDPFALLSSAGERTTDRKARLFCVACCRQVLHLAPAARRKRAEALLKVAERFADSEPTRAERLKAQKKAGGSYSMIYATLAVRMTAADGHYAARFAADFASFGEKGIKEEITQAAQADLARDILGPTAVGPSPLKPNWLTSTVVALAKGIYNDRAFDRMPILADALQDAGCEKADILDHCRGPGPHARGCWVVDLVLRKA
jgi:hypothetical protein